MGTSSCPPGGNSVNVYWMNPRLFCVFVQVCMIFSSLQDTCCHTSGAPVKMWKTHLLVMYRKMCKQSKTKICFFESCSFVGFETNYLWNELAVCFLVCLKMLVSKWPFRWLLLFSIIYPFPTTYPAPSWDSKVLAGQMGYFIPTVCFGSPPGLMCQNNYTVEPSRGLLIMWSINFMPASSQA